MTIIGIASNDNPTKVYPGMHNDDLEKWVNVKNVIFWSMKSVTLIVPLTTQMVSSIYKATTRQSSMSIVEPVTL